MVPPPQITNIVPWRVMRRKAVTTLSLYGPLNEWPLPKLMYGEMESRLHFVLDTLRKAASDPLVKGVRLDISQLSCGLAKVIEIVDARVGTHTHIYMYACSFCLSSCMYMNVYIYIYSMALSIILSLCVCVCVCVCAPSLAQSVCS